MKKIFSLILAVSMVLVLFAGIGVSAEGETIAVTDDGSKVTLDLTKGTLASDNECALGITLSEGNVKTSADGAETKAHFLERAYAVEYITWNVNFAKEGNYKIEIPVYTMDGVGAISVYLNGAKMYSAGNFTAGGYNQPRIYSNNAELYVTADKAGEAELTIYFDCLGVYMLAPQISYFEGEIPAQPAIKKYVRTAVADSLTSSPAKAFLLDEETYYGLHVNTAKAFSGITLPQWTPGGGQGHCKFKLSVYNWDEDEQKTIEGTPVATKEFTTPGDCIMSCEFDNEIPAGNYYIYIECVELSIDEGSTHTGGVQMHMKSGLPMNVDDTYDYYFEAYTNIVDYVIVPERMVYMNLIVSEDVEPVDMFLELYDGSDEPAESEKPTATTKPTTTEKPTATAKPTGTPANKTNAPSNSGSNNNDDNNNTGLLIGIIAGAAVVVIAAVVAIIVIKKKK